MFFICKKLAQYYSVKQVAGYALQEFQGEWGLVGIDYARKGFMLILSV
jgi:hypothetical protein